MRVYRPYWELEEHDAGMWRQVNGDARQPFIEAAANLMRDIPKFRQAMFRAIREWPQSCEAAMTTTGLNHQAWFGHAGCCIATGSPEELTRLAWHTLTADEQREANLAADAAISQWHKNYRHSENMTLFDA